ncbi:MAG: hypothetical protein ACOX89_08610 [Lutispora sp.]|uniref:hypothetical protein n=1 Tax=Lutispora sp. TaxID=2828727 RepID=UPI00356B58CE
MLRGKSIKIIFAFTMVFVMMLSSIASVYARRLDDPIPVFDFVNGIEEVEQPVKYSNKKLSIKGKALEGTNITISTYWYKSGDGQSIVFKDKDNISEENTDGEWLLQHTKSCQVGLSGIFGISVNIKPGKNKIVVEADNEEPYELEIEYIDNQKITEKIGDLIFDRLNLEF